MKRSFWLPEKRLARLDGYLLTGEVSVCPVRYLPEHQTMAVSQKEHADLFGVYVQIKERFRGTDCFEWRWLHDFATQQPALACAENLRQGLAAVRFEKACRCKDNREIKATTAAKDARKTSSQQAASLQSA